MPKVKELSNQQLYDYLEAYESMLSSDSKNQIYLRKIKCIRTALEKRDIVGYDLDTPNSSKGILNKILSIFKKKK